MTIDAVVRAYGSLTPLERSLSVQVLSYYTEYLGAGFQIFNMLMLMSEVGSEGVVSEGSKGKCASMRLFGPF